MNQSELLRRLLCVSCVFAKGQGMQTIMRSMYVLMNGSNFLNYVASSEKSNTNWIIIRRVYQYSLPGSVCRQTEPCPATQN